MLRTGSWNRIPIWVRGLAASIVAHAVLLALLCHSPGGCGSAPVAQANSRLAERFELFSDNIQLLNLGPTGTRKDAGSDVPVASADPAPIAKLNVAAELPKPAELASDPVIAASSLNAGTENLRCEVRVHQNPYGEVEAFELGDCRGDSAWREAMIKVMQRAVTMVTPRSEPEFAALRTISLEVGEISPRIVAERLSNPDPHRESFVQAISPKTSLDP